MTVALGMIVGLVLGLTGAGGSVFAVPLLMFGLGWTLREAVPVALMAVCAAATFGTVVAWDRTYVRYRAAILMSVAGTLAAPLGLQAAHSVSTRMLSLLFGAALALIAVRMIVQARSRPLETTVARAAVAGDSGHFSGTICRLHGQTGRLVWTRPCAAVIAMVGAVTGFLSGMLGVGGGFVIVPALRSVSALSVHSSIATSLMVIALTSAGTVLVHLAVDDGPPWTIALPFIGGALLGMVAGRRVAPWIAGPALQQGFALSMLLVAGVMALRTTG